MSTPYAPFYAGQELAADDLNTDIVAETMPWTALATVGAYATNFSAGAPAPRMRKLMVAATEVWEFEGRINMTLAANTLTTAFTFNTGYRVGSERGFHQWGASLQFYPLFVAFESNGQVRVGVPTAGGAGGSAFTLDGIYITNPLI